jgi:hypothetical protein
MVAKIAVNGAAALSKRGFTQVPNHLLRSDKVSAGAKLAYRMLLAVRGPTIFSFRGKNGLQRA